MSESAGNLFVISAPSGAGKSTLVKNLIESGSGSLHSVERMGKRRLSYDIRDEPDGHYTVVHFTSEPERITPLQRSFRLNESILRPQPCGNGDVPLVRKGLLGIERLFHLQRVQVANAALRPHMPLYLLSQAPPRFA